METASQQGERVETLAINERGRGLSLKDTCCSANWLHEETLYKNNSSVLLCLVRRNDPNIVQRSTKYLEPVPF